MGNFAKGAGWRAKFVRPLSPGSLTFSPRAAPRFRLQGPQTTEMSWSLTGWPRAFRSHA